MCTSPTRRRLRRPSAVDGGFTVIEVMVALVVLAIIAGALVPLLVAGARASVLTRLATEAKNLSNARIAAMRNLPYHVAFNNGNFVDVLDEYYTNASTTPTMIPPTGGKGVYVPSGTVPGQSVAGAYYQVQLPASVLPTGFTQTVDTQFLVPLASAGTGATILSPPATYNSQATGVDQPPSLIIGVTVITTYQTAGGVSHTYRAYTEIANGGHDNPLVVGQAGATAIRVSSTAYDGTALSAVLGQVGIDARLANDSTASAQAVAARFDRTDPTGGTTYPTLFGAQASAVAPPDPAAPALAPGSAGTTGSVLGSGCGWGSMGPTSVSDVSSTVASAQPRAPQDVESASPPANVGASLNANGGGACAGFNFTNDLSGSPATNAALGLSAGEPIVSVPDLPGSGSVVSSTANVDTPALPFTGTRPPVTSNAAITFNQEIDVFPDLSFVTDGTHHRALVWISLQPLSIACASNNSNATATYAGTINVWTSTAPGIAAYKSYPLTSPPPGTVVVGYAGVTPVPLSNYLTFGAAPTVVQPQPAGGGTTTSVGDHTVPAAVTLVTAPILNDSSGALNPDTAVSVAIGQLSCVSEDSR